MANPTLSAVMWGLALLVSAVAVLSFARGLTHMWRTVSAGTPDPGRLTPVGKRLWGVISAALTHREFKGRPWIKAAHWLVMVSFPILFLTLVTGYAQLRVQTFTLPLLGNFAPWEWLTEVFAWGGLAGIIALMVVRQRAGHGTAGASRGPGVGTAGGGRGHVVRRDVTMAARGCVGALDAQGYVEGGGWCRAGCGWRTRAGWLAR